MQNIYNRFSNRNYIWTEIIDILQWYAPYFENKRNKEFSISLLNNLSRWVSICRYYEIFQLLILFEINWKNYNENPTCYLHYLDSNCEYMSENVLQIYIPFMYTSSNYTAVQKNCKSHLRTLNWAHSNFNSNLLPLSTFIEKKTSETFL